MIIANNKAAMLFGIVFISFSSSIGMVIENEYKEFINRIYKANTQEELDKIYDEVYNSNEDVNSLIKLFSAIKERKYRLELQEIKRELESPEISDDDIIYYFVRLKNIEKNSGGFFSKEISSLLDYCQWLFQSSVDQVTKKEYHTAA